MGMVFAEGKYTALTDISGAEDAFGDMDFKVAGTSEFVTALQLDTKIDGLPADVLANALRQAYEARVKIMEVMARAISEPNADVKGHAPKITSFEIPIDKIGEVIGPKGKVINALQQETGADIAVDDDGMVGTVTIGAKDANAVAEAKRRISLILDPPSADVGEVYSGKVVNLTKFGAFVNVLPGRDGLLHISKLSSLADGKRVGAVEDVLTLGQAIEVRVDDIDQQGKVSLSLASDPPSEPGARASGGSRGSDRPDRSDRPERSERAERPDRSRRQDGPHEGPSTSNGGASFASFEDAFEAELVADLGDLGPGAPSGGEGRPGGDRDRQRSRRPQRRR
jgi:polyribonucleotide nucleotidyltransferase